MFVARMHLPASRALLALPLFVLFLAGPPPVARAQGPAADAGLLLGTPIDDVQHVAQRSLLEALGLQSQAPAVAPEAAPPTVDPPLPPNPALRANIPLSGVVDAGENIHVTGVGGRLTLIVRDAPLNRVLAVLAQTQQLNIVAAEDISARVTITLYEMPLEDVLHSVLSVAGYTWTRYNHIIHVTSASSLGALPPEVQGRQLRVFSLDYVAASELEPMVKGLISPIGKVYISEISPTNHRRARELLVVEDLPVYVQRIEEYICQIDQPPRQVLIQAHILEVDLQDDQRHGVDFQSLTDIADKRLTLQTAGFMNNMGMPSIFASFDSNKFDALIDFLQTTTDSKTLASPRLMVLNGQEARIQVGEQLGFRVTTTTETSSLESVNFLDLGVVLSVTPHISQNGQILMHVRPEVSSGRINPDTMLPEEETSQVETDVLLEHGQGLIIGGLIQEKESDVQSKLPWLGDLWLVGKLFQRRQDMKNRQEIIVALIPWVVPIGACEGEDLRRARTRLFHGPLDRVPRPWSPVLPSAEAPFRSPRRLPPQPYPGMPGIVNDVPNYATPPFGPSLHSPLPSPEFVPAPEPYIESAEPLPDRPSTEYRPPDKELIRTGQFLPRFTRLPQTKRTTIP